MNIENFKTPTEGPVQDSNPRSDRGDMGQQVGDFCAGGTASNDRVEQVQREALGHPEPTQNEVEGDGSGKSPNLSGQIPEPKSPNLRQIPEPSPNLLSGEGLEIPEPKSPNPVRGFGDEVRGFADSAPEPFDLGEEVDGNLDQESRLWNLETYKDRHGKYRLRRVLRFVQPPVRIELGTVTGAIKEQLACRSGRGRWGKSRSEAGAFRTAAQLTAEQFKRDKRGRLYGASLQSARRNGISNRGDRYVPNAQPDPLGEDLPPLLM